jgi:hypothetical protein
MLTDTMLKEVQNPARNYRIFLTPININKKKQSNSVANRAAHMCVNLYSEPVTF